VLSKEVQHILSNRIMEMTKEDLLALGQIPLPAAETLMYNLVPELDYIMLERLPALRGHKYDPNRVLHGKAIQQVQQGRVPGLETEQAAVQRAPGINPEQQAIMRQGPRPPQGPAPGGALRGIG
jgi:hypothetical protein